MAQLISKRHNDYCHDQGRINYLVLAYVPERVFAQMIHNVSVSIGCKLRCVLLVSIKGSIKMLPVSILQVKK